MSWHPVTDVCMLTCEPCLSCETYVLSARAGLAGPRVLEKGRAEVPSSSSSSSGSDPDCDEEAAGAGARRQNRRARAACSTETYSVWTPRAVKSEAGSLALCPLSLPCSSRAHRSVRTVVQVASFVLKVCWAEGAQTRKKLLKVTENRGCWPCRRSRRWRRRAPGAWGAVLGGGLGMRRAETAPAELPLEALGKGASAVVHALDLAAPTREGAGAGIAVAGARTPGHAGESIFAGNGLALAPPENRQGAGGAGSSTSGRAGDGGAAGVDADVRDGDDTEQGARAAGFGRALAGSGAGGSLLGKAPVAADRSRLVGEGGGNGTPSGPGPPSYERASR